jgi:flagellar biosynthetic protein FlhB
MAMADPERERRTLPATPRRREEMRRRGLVPRSPDVAPALGVAGLLVAVLSLAPAAPGLARTVAAALVAAGDPRPLTPEGAVADMAALGAAGARAALPVLVLAWALVAGGLLAVQGVTFAFPAGGLGRLNPMQGLARIASRQALGGLGLALLKLAGAAAAGAAVLAGPLVAWAHHPLADPVASLDAFRGTLTALAGALAGVGAVVGTAGALQARRRYEADLRMTPEELREEMRRNEGDPQVRRRRLGQHRRLVRQRLVEAVRAADVVVVNPTHVAVALLYQPGRMPAPEVTAKGAERVAERMREVARRAGVPVVVNRPLARALWRDVDVGGRVPPALFVAVAEVLAFVYRQRGYVPGAGGEGR